jgi:cobaltochelatase CobN
LDNNDSFDYLGGLSLAVESVKGQVPENFVIFHPDADHLTIEPLQVALLSELRGRYLNPQWLKPLMAEGYAGARTMGSEFLEYLWGWQVTNPEVIKSWVWDEVKQVYIDDKLDLGLDEFLEQGHNAHVKSNMLAVMLVAAQKGFWQADEQTLQQLAEAFAQLVIKNGLPGSGHTSPDHPLYPWLEQHLPADQYAQLQQLLAVTKVTTATAASPSIVAEIDLQASAVAQQQAQPEVAEQQNLKQQKQQDKKQGEEQMEPLDYLGMVLMLAALLLIGWWRGTRMPDVSKN